MWWDLTYPWWFPSQRACLENEYPDISISFISPMGFVCFLHIGIRLDERFSLMAKHMPFSPPGTMWHRTIHTSGRFVCVVYSNLASNAWYKLQLIAFLITILCYLYPIIMLIYQWIKNLFKSMICTVFQTYFSKWDISHHAGLRIFRVKEERAAWFSKILNNSFECKTPFKQQNHTI